MTENAPEPPPDAELPPGRMLTAVERDLQRMEDLNTGVRGSLAALARELAGAMDATGDNQPTPAQVGQLGQQLRTTLLALAEVASDSSATEAFLRLMSTAVRNAEDAQSENIGTTRCPNCGDPRETVDAMAEIRDGRSSGDHGRRAPSIPYGDSGGDAAER